MNRKEGTAMEGGNGRRKISWETGTLSTFELEQILMDVLSDLWADCYRRDDRESKARLRDFRRKVELALYCATSHELRIERQ